MRIYTSYFYKIRFFPSNVIPLSTAMFDPKWYYDFKEQGYIFYDKRGVLNGMRAEPFIPKANLSGLCYGPEGCKESPEHCAFLTNYLNQLRHLNFDEIMERFRKLNDKLPNESDFALIVHEAPDRECSERKMIQKWFAENGLPIAEWEFSGNPQKGEK